MDEWIGWVGPGRGCVIVEGISGFDPILTKGPKKGFSLGRRMVVLALAG